MGLKDKVGKKRRSKGVRLFVIILLILITGILFYFWKAARVYLAVAFLSLLLALGLESTNKDFDINKLLKTKSFEKSKIERTESGQWLIGEECQKEKLNCDNFKYQEDAQDLFEKCGGVQNDVNGLDRDKDGIVCEHLPKKSSK